MALGVQLLCDLLHLVHTNKGVMNVTQSHQAIHGDLLSNTVESLVYTPVYMVLCGMEKQKIIYSSLHKLSILIVNLFMITIDPTIYIVHHGNT